MGLDVTAYSNLQKIDCVFDANGEPIHPDSREPLGYDYFHPCVNPDFPGRNDPIEDRALYRYEKAIGFHAGSYSGYNRWREMLAELSGWPLREYERWGTKWPSHAVSAADAVSGPFWELIWFSDCEGVIGYKVAAKLAKDFAEHQAKADVHDDEWWRGRYAKWREAFDLAALDGALRFH